MEQRIRELVVIPLLRKPASTFEELAYLSTQYRELERHPAWQDFSHRLVEMKATVENEVLRGSLDKFGKDRSDEKRAVHHFLTNILAIAPALHRDYDVLQQRLQKRVEDRTVNMNRTIPEHLTNWSQRG